MMNIVPLLVAAALASLQGSSAFARLGESSSLELDNKLMPNDVPEPDTTPKHRTVGKYIKIATPPPETVRYVPGTSLVLECEIMGNPAPFAEWLKNGVPVSNTQEDEEFVPIDQLSPAFLSSRHVVRSAVNGDVYTCVGSSSESVVSASTTVYVDGDASETRLNEVMPAKPVVTLYYTDLLLNRGTPATLLCRAHSATPSHTMWMDNNNKIVYENSRVRVLPSGDLYIKAVDWADMGIWTCSVKNAYGREAVGTFLYPLAVRSTRV